MVHINLINGAYADKVLGEPCAIRRCYQKDECVALLNSPIGIYKKNYRCECKRRGLFRWGPLCSEGEISDTVISSDNQSILSY